MTRRYLVRAAVLALALAAAPETMPPGKAAAGAGSSRASSGPFDLQLALHEHFAAALPAGWWIGPPQRWGNEVFIRVNIPESWNGNPTAAMMNACPDSRSPIWQAARHITLSPHYRNLSWAAHQCLP